MQHLFLILVILKLGSARILYQFRVYLVIPGLVPVQLVQNSVILFVWH